MVVGRESAFRLGVLLHEVLPPAEQGLRFAATVLVDEVLSSFSRALLALDAEVKAEACHGSTISLAKRKATPALRRAYRRRAHPYSSSTSITSRTLDDGHAWRKYGQKEIHGSRSLRSYYRCTYRPDQGCQATRHVQQSEDDPSTFVITYIGKHTCKHPGESADTPFLISFGSVSGGAPPPVPSPFCSLKQEPDEMVMSGHTPSCSSSEYLARPDVAQFDLPEMMRRATGEDLDQGDASSSLNSCSGSLELDFMVDIFDADCIFSFD